MLLNGDDGPMLNHHLVCIIISVGNILVLEGDDVLLEHILTRGLACSANGLKAFVNLNKGLLRVFLIPLGLVLPVKVIVMHGLMGMLEV